MPAYNAEKYISEAIESILAQTYTNWELIIVNDGSTDSTEEIVRIYQEEDARIIFFQFPENKGISKARNQCLKLARGLYLANLDSDDVAYPERISEQVDFMLTNKNIDVCGSSVNLFGLSSSVWKTYLNNDQIRCSLLFSATIPNSSAMFRKDILSKYNIQYDHQYKVAHDLQFWVLLPDDCKLANLPIILTKIRLHENNTSYNEEILLQETNQIYTYQLQNYLQISPTEEELRTHHELVKTPEEGFTIEYIKRISKWLNRLAEANQKTRHYPEPEFTDLLTQLWYKNTAGLHHLGLEFGKVFSQSPFSEYKDYSLWQKIKFWAKCLFK
jgi:glycosyltransferase involved in cell wall biosynthesis